ncbi:hypothetical protein, partial [Mixta sp.]|uniref:hypothetical protein n=1 Tax=Mixta sp. TaxID=2100765 RepID=UPI00258CC6E0
LLMVNIFLKWRIILQRRSAGKRHCACFTGVGVLINGLWCRLHHLFSGRMTAWMPTIRVIRLTLLSI